VSSRIRNHIRGNVVGYVALFLVVTGGTAQALNGSNTVFSDDIVNREVKTADLGLGAVIANRLAPNSVRTGRVVDESLTGDDIGNLTGADVANDSLTGAQINESQVGIGGDLFGSLAVAELKSNVVGSNQVALNALTSADVDESSLTTVPNATTAANAERVDGQSSEVFSMHEPDPPENGPFVTVGGLTMRVHCIGVSPGSDNVEIEARTDTDNSWIQAVAKADTVQNPATTQSDLNFMAGEVLEVQTPGDGTGHLVYRRGTSGEIVTATFGYNEGTSSCDAMGVMVGTG
jgi:hypothetical protein